MKQTANLSHKTEIKKNLIKLLMFNLYPDEKDLFREYVQNAADSIDEAVKSGVLNQMSEGLVSILIDKCRKVITIRDNGKGINSQEAVMRLLDVAGSTKDGVSQAGQFGIGRLVGGGFCKKLVFRTTAKGDSNGVVVSFDTVSIGRIVNDKSKDCSANDIFDQCTTKAAYETDRDEHYFEVTMEGVKDEYSDTLLNEDLIRNYLSEVAPVDYSVAFKTNFIEPLSNVNFQDYKRFNELKTINLSVNGRNVIKNYELEVKGTKDKIDRIDCFEIRDKVFGLMGWGWVAITPFTTAIPISDNASQIRLRKHNIQIGGRNFLTNRTFWSEVRCNTYYYGEVMITHKDVQPTADRNHIIPNDATKAFFDALRLRFSKINQLWRTASDLIASEKQIRQGLKLMESGSYSYQAKNMIETQGFDIWKKHRNRQYLPVVHMVNLYEESFDQLKSEYDRLRMKSSTIEAPVKKTTLPSQNVPQQEVMTEENLQVPDVLKSVFTPDVLDIVEQRTVRNILNIIDMALLPEESEIKNRLYNAINKQF